MQCTESNNDQVWRQKLPGVFSIVRDGARFSGRSARGISSECPNEMRPFCHHALWYKTASPHLPGMPRESKQPGSHGPRRKARLPEVNLRARKQFRY